MAGFPEHRRALTDAAFATFGEDAFWQGGADPVRVRWRDQDEDDRFGRVTMVRQSTILRVRGWEVEPATDDLVEVVEGERAGVWTVKSQPMMDARGVWNCQVVRAS